MMITLHFHCNKLLCFANSSSLYPIHTSFIKVSGRASANGTNRPSPSSLVPLFENESKCENEFCLQFHFHANQSHFRKNGFALRLALKQRHKGTRKWPIGEDFVIREFKLDVYGKRQK